MGEQAQEARSGLSRCNKGLGRNGCSACTFITGEPWERLGEHRRDIAVVAKHFDFADTNSS